MGLVIKIICGIAGGVFIWMIIEMLSKKFGKK